MTAPAVNTFAGFPQEGLDVLAGLAADNTREYFDAHRATYESALLEPAKAFVVTLGEQLRSTVSPEIRAEPRVNGSILRINRDTRFSSDKRPYKEHLDMWFWEGDAPSRERPGYSVRLKSATVMLGAGMHRFEPAALAAYREAVDDDRRGEALETAIEDATMRREISLGGLTYKRVPREYDRDHPRAELLRHGALYVSGEWKLPRVVSGPKFVGWVADRLLDMVPVERWLSATIPTGSPGSSGKGLEVLDGAP
jgi:uncharacterized protein (TIGR02453 family)